MINELKNFIIIKKFKIFLKTKKLSFASFKNFLLKKKDFF